MKTSEILTLRILTFFMLHKYVGRDGEKVAERMIIKCFNKAGFVKKQKEYQRSGKRYIN